MERSRFDRDNIIHNEICLNSTDKSKLRAHNGNLNSAQFLDNSRFIIYFVPKSNEACTRRETVVSSCRFVKVYARKKQVSGNFSNVVC